MNCEVCQTEVFEVIGCACNPYDRRIEKVVQSMENLIESLIAESQLHSAAAVRHSIRSMIDAAEQLELADGF